MKRTKDTNDQVDLPSGNRIIFTADNVEQAPPASLTLSGLPAGVVVREFVAVSENVVVKITRHSSDEGTIECHESGSLTNPPVVQSLDRLLQQVLPIRLYKRLFERLIADWQREEYETHARGGNQSEFLCVRLKYIIYTAYMALRTLWPILAFLWKCTNRD